LDAPEYIRYSIFFKKPNLLLDLYQIFAFSLSSLYSLFTTNDYYSLGSKGQKQMLEANI